jgi:hypothetical protein
VGEFQTNFGDWTVLESSRSKNGFYFVAALRGGDTIRLRLTERPVQMIFTQAGGFRILSGVCDPIE